MKTYYVEVPPVDNSKPHIVIEEFTSLKEAIEFCNQAWDLKDEMFCMISQVGNDFIVDTPNPNINSTNNQFLEIEGIRENLSWQNVFTTSHSQEELGRSLVLPLLT